MARGKSKIPTKKATDSIEMKKAHKREKNDPHERKEEAQPYDPRNLASKHEKIVLRRNRRKYYRLARPGHWYGGIATADCCGCNLRCVFCWSGEPRDDLENIGTFYEPLEVAQALASTARKHRYRLARISGNEPTLTRGHLLQVIHGVEQAGLAFILETNGLLVDLSLAKALSSFSNLHVRVSLKGTNPEEFTRLTGAQAEGFSLQLAALENLLVAGVSCHPAVMTSFSAPEKLVHLRESLQMISSELVSNLEEETVILYPHVAQRLKRAGIDPTEAYGP
jgi:uncharacterized Fe-S cluster-containing radical SAM superfamily protein